MKLERPAQAGTIESSDIQVTLSPAAEGNGIQIELVSPTFQQYGGHIIQLIEKTVQSFGIENATVFANDKGALDCTILARLTTAVERATKNGGE